jgi:hypothetical protein
LDLLLKQALGCIASHCHLPGEVSENRNYTAADMGSYTRPIREAELTVSRSFYSTTFRFSGTAGPTDLSTVCYSRHLANETTRTQLLTPYIFDAAVEIPDRGLSMYCDNAVLALMQQRIDGKAPGK